MITNTNEYKQRLKEIQESVNVVYTSIPSDEPRFVIDANSRQINIPSEFSFLALKKDHKAETIYFEIDRYFDDNDLSNHTCVIQFELFSYDTNDLLYSGISPITSIDIESEDGKIIFGWALTNDVTQFNATIRFSVRFFTIENDSFTYSFNTLPAISIILDTLDVDDSSNALITPSELQNWLDRMNQINNNINELLSDVNESVANAEESASEAKNALSDVIVAKTDSINTIDEAKTEAVKAVADAGSAQKKILDDAVAEIVSDREQISVNTTDISSLKGDLGELINIDFGELLDGKYVNSANGNISDSSSYKYTDFITTNGVTKIRIYCGFKVANVGIALYNSEKNYVIGYDNSTGNIGDTKQIDIPNNVSFIRICTLNQYADNLFIKAYSLHKSLANKQDKLVVGVNVDAEPKENSDNPITSNGVYVALGEKLNNNAMDGILGRATYTQLLDKTQFLDGKLLDSTATVSTPNDMSDSPNNVTTNIIELDFNSFDGVREFETNLQTGQFIALGYFLHNGQYVRSAYIAETESFDGHFKFSMPEVNVKMRLSIRKDLVNPEDIIITKKGEWTTEPSYGTNVLVFKDGSIKKRNLDASIQKELFSENPCDYKGNEFQIFKKVLCIGDSLTEGTFDYFEGSTRRYFVDKDYSYPSILSALTGRTVVNKGFGGDTFHSWYERYKNDDLSGFDCAIIELGLNDSTQNTTSADRLEYLGKIVSKLKSENNGIKIFISTIFKCYSNNNIPLVNADIISFANSTDNCYLMNVYENGHLEPNSAYVAGHLTVLGYQRLARDYYAYASKIISENMPAFQYVQYVGSDKNYQ